MSVVETHTAGGTRRCRMQRASIGEAKKLNRRVRRIFLLSAPVALLAAVALSAWVPRAESGGAGRRTFDVTYQFTIRDIPPGAKSIKAWIPVPLSDKWQILEGFRVEGPWPHEIVDEKEYGNRFVRIDLSGAGQEVGADAAVTLTFRVNRKAYHALEEAVSPGERPSQEALGRFLAPDRLVPIDGKIAEEAERVAGRVEDPLQRARLIYDHIIGSMVYDKSGVGWGRGDAVYACDMRTGNCTDFHSLFIGETRSLGVPSRFIMGLPVPQDSSEGPIAGYHCWAEFYVDGKGWIPIDASEAHKNRSRQDALFGGLDANRIAFTIGRDIVIPGTNGGLLNYLIYPHVEIEGKPYGKVDTSFYFREVDREESKS